MGESKISYSAVVLDEKSKQLLVKKFQSFIPNDWEVIAHHMTINMGNIEKHLEKYLGLKIPLYVKSYGLTNNILAVGVDGFESKNKQPHVTVALNRKGGAKPKMSNDIEVWEPLKKQLMLTGVVKEIPYVL